MVYQIYHQIIGVAGIETKLWRIIEYLDGFFDLNRNGQSLPNIIA
jgi:hypothetical protein